MTANEFQILYKKFMEGKCTPEEEAALHAYQDEIKLLDANWDASLGDQQLIHDRLKDRIHESRYGKPKKNYAWLKIAASILILFGIGYFWMAGNRPVETTNLTQQLIKPGSNQAYLITSAGKKILLTDAKNGQLTEQAGVKISKAKDGLLVYDLSSAKPGDNELVYNTIGTPRGGQYWVTLADGSKVLLNSASSLSFPVAFKGKERRVQLQGEAYFEVAKNEKMPFIVEASGTNVNVLGTHFNVSAYADDNSVTTTLLEGSVRLNKGAASALLTPGFQGIALNTENSFKVQRADIKTTIAWKDGYFYFKEMDIKTIMKQMSRWYDVDLAFEGSPLKNDKFSGKISKYKDITELLKNFELTESIHFRIEGKKVIVIQN